MYTKEIYEHLGMKQSYLLSIASEATQYITEMKKATMRKSIRTSVFVT